MIRTIMTVPKIAGNTPPSVFDSRGSLHTNSATRATYRQALAGRLIAFGASTCRIWISGSSFSLPPPELREPCCLGLVPSLKGRHLPLQRIDRRPARHALEGHAPQSEADLLLRVVDRAYFAFFDALDLATGSRHAGEAALELGEALLGSDGDGPIAVPDLLDRSDEKPPLRALHHQ